VSPCSQDGTDYAWCWVKENKQAWDWCCFLGETCGAVFTRDKQDNKDMCYTKNGHNDGQWTKRWPMECNVSSIATPLPHDFESPPTPLGWGAIAGIACAVVLFILCSVLCLCYWVKS